MKSVALCVPNGTKVKGEGEGILSFVVGVGFHGVGLGWVGEKGLDLLGVKELRN